MKTILCYGDSNTHGANSADGPRFDHYTRWPGVLRNNLGDNYWVIEEGCRGRTTMLADPFDPRKNGAMSLLMLLESHKSIDLVVIFLGTNDLKHCFGASVENIARGIETLVGICLSSTMELGCSASPPDVLVIAPPPLAKIAGTPYAEMFAGGEEKSHELGASYEKMAARIGWHFLNAGAFVKTSVIDGIHLDAEAHTGLGTEIAAKVQGIFSLQQQTVG